MCYGTFGVGHESTGEHLATQEMLTVHSYLVCV